MNLNQSIGLKSKLYGTLLCLLLVIAPSIGLIHGQNKKSTTSLKSTTSPKSTISLKSASAQTSEEERIEKVLTQLFDGMRAGDSASVAQVFHKDAILQSTWYDQSGQNKFKNGDLAGFIKAIGSPHEAVWDEQIDEVVMRVDDGLAQIWCPYAFYLGEKFSHCGVNAISLVKDENQEWKIIHLIDTRRKEQCLFETK